MLEETGAVERDLTEQLEQARTEAEEANKALHGLKQILANADSEKAEVGRLSTRH